MSTERKKLWRSPSELEGKRIGRAVILPDGNAVVETWHNGNWVRGGAAIHEFLIGDPMPLERRVELGLIEDADPPDNPDN